MADIDAYKDKFSESGQPSSETALGESKKRDQNYVSIEHILHAITLEEEDLFASTIRDLLGRSAFSKTAYRKAHGEWPPTQRQRLSHRA